MTGGSTPASPSSRAAPDSAYIAALWEYPTLCLAFFGVQLLTPEGQALYEASGISDAMRASLRDAPGLLCTRYAATPEGPVLMQYWDDYEHLHAWARVAPHTQWWKWLMDHRGKGVGFYHEVYTLRGAEAIYETGTQPVGPATFCRLEAVRSGEGRSRQRLDQFRETGE